MSMTIKERILKLSEFGPIYQAWIEANGSRSPSVKTAIEWEHARLKPLIEELAELLQKIDTIDYYWSKEIKEMMAKLEGRDG